jgi:mannose-1-phosphate guanylyltransferase / mannose-6-phosphate isomerase
VSEPRPILPVILCGGGGTRLWPLSTDAEPKPFHPLITENTLFQETLARVAGPAAAAEGFLPPLIVCGRSHRAIAEAQAATAGVTPMAMIIEPCGRGSAPVAAIASAVAETRAPGALVLLVSADHRIPDDAAFRRTIRVGAALADERIVVLGIAPTRAETAYGYIQRGAELAPGVHVVARFTEKPDPARAEAFIADGEHSWNAGVFLFAPALLLAELKAARPELAEAALAALPARQDGPVIALDEALFTRCPADSIDRAVMERTRRAAVALASFEWADVGAWDEVWRLRAGDGDGNLILGDVWTRDTRDSLVWSEGPTIATIGIEDLVVVATADAVLIAPRARAQEVRAAAEAIAARKSKAG